MKNELFNDIYSKLIKQLPIYWDGREIINYLKNNGSKQWKQMEWAGFYFQFMCEKILQQDNFFEIPGKKYGNVQFDGYKKINFDFKAHSILPGSRSDIPTNGFEAIKSAIDEYLDVCFIVASGDVTFDDENQSFKKWHDALKGKTSKYETQRISRGAISRRRKTSFSLREITFFLVNKNNLGIAKTFQGGMRNSDGSPRAPKVMINLDSKDFEKYVFQINRP
jgi:hypothetical protein